MRDTRPLIWRMVSMAASCTDSSGSPSFSSMACSTGSKRASLLPASACTAALRVEASGACRLALAISTCNSCLMSASFSRASAVRIRGSCAGSTAFCKACAASSRTVRCGASNCKPDKAPATAARKRLLTITPSMPSGSGTFWPLAGSYACSPSTTYTLPSGAAYKASSCRACRTLAASGVARAAICATAATRASGSSPDSGFSSSGGMAACANDTKNRQARTSSLGRICMRMDSM